ncbi:hypothetical protein SAMN00808754_2886 [Thermanaeromonas toyohensis ToBE]|uniref:Haemolysin XhlA n=1 Tax=Thermanaeromonas toyohensis ToBE TaxID=698762 RepID=A0A1W1W1N8_9FIRM|nr:hypothetical protein [Thermanaeromonas toyohensis]SMB99400.1 hypothetical protein SAMN00808754_2886 [Thermanaeromonas toyohensis ToBE]
MTEEAKKEEFHRVSPWDVLIWKLDSLEKYVQREISDLRREMGDLRREMGDLRQEIVELRREVREEMKGTRQSYAVLEWTAILGFVAIIVTIFATKFL